MIRILAILLLLQLVLATALYWPEAQQRGAPAALLAGARADVTGLTVSGESSEVTLSRGDSGWTLDSGLPADAARVDLLLGALLESDPGYAIANSDSAARRFEVSEEEFQRRVSLATEGGETLTAYIGSSPAFRKVHARADGSSAIHVLDLNSYDAPTAAESWLDRKLLAVNSVDGIALAEQRFVLAEDSWVREGDDAADADAQALEDLVQALASLQVSGLAGEEDRALAEAGATAVALTLSRQGESVSLTLLENDDRYFARSSRFPQLFNTSSYDAERIIDAARALLGDDVDSEGAGADTPGAADGSEPSPDVDAPEPEPEPKEEDGSAAP
jgi:hypothetical protein